MSFKQKKNIPAEEVFLKMQHYCAYQERCEEEVLQKLQEFDVSEESKAQIITLLIDDNFVNNERFAKIYAQSKFRLKKWGRLKIQQALKGKKIAAPLIVKALNEIDEIAYSECLENILATKQAQLSQKTDELFVIKQKAAAYALSKGFESSLIWEILR
ncbi:MAG: regulatory protein RecX [Chitinophagales bacterium]|nr:RecX family transcriptional regulator [Bacteroidota bacterium]MCB9042207.1 RecX family transcriptional regulator [Chitinophagales bacterium]